jgi:hypothetical protein
MATDYRHAGCTTPLLRDLPDGEPKAGAVVIAKDWLLLPSEQAPMPNSPLPVCPDCWRPGRPTLGSLEAVYKIRQPKPTDYAAREAAGEQFTEDQKRDAILSGGIVPEHWVADIAGTLGVESAAPSNGYRGLERVPA